MHSNRYIYTFVAIMTAVVALALAFLFTALKPIHDRNEAIYAKKAILSAVNSKIDGDVSGMTNEEILQIFNSNIEQRVLDTDGNILSEEQILDNSDGATKAEEIDMAKQKKKNPSERVLPFYVFKADDGSEYYIVSMRGNGLWDEIWGNVAFESDLNTIAGVSFDHKAETPGLGAEIKDNKGWYNQYIGKEIYNEKGELVSVKSIKGGAKDPNHQIDAISGATITGDGVNDMMEAYLNLYQPYLESLKKS